MTKEWIIAFDCDDVLTDFVGAWRRYLNLKYGLDVQADDIKSWDIENFFPSLSREQVFGAFSDDVFWEHIYPKEGAPDFLRRLHGEGYEIFVCTSTLHRNIVNKFKVIQRYFPWIDWRHVIVTAHKELVNCDILVDDAIHNLQGKQPYKILMDMPHNRDEDFNTKCFRVHNWSELYDTIHRITKESE